MGEAKRRAQAEGPSSSIEQYKKLKETLAVVERIAILAITRMGGTMRIKDEEWATAEAADMQWRTLRVPGLAPEIHVAVTLQGEAISVPALSSKSN